MVAVGVHGGQVYTGGLGERALTDPAVARRHATEYLAATGAHARYPGLACRVDTGADAVRVRVTAPLDLPFAPPGWAAGTLVTGPAAAHVVVTD